MLNLWLVKKVAKQFPPPFFVVAGSGIEKNTDPVSGMQKKHRSGIRYVNIPDPQHWGGPMLPVAEAGVPEERQVDALELGVAEVLSPPALDVLDPVDDDGTPQDVGQAQDVGLLQRRTRLARQAAHNGHILTIQRWNSWPSL